MALLASSKFLSRASGISSVIAQRFDNYFTFVNEKSHSLNREPKIVTNLVEAVPAIKSGDTVFCSGAAAIPISLLNAMVDHGVAGKLKDVTVCHMHTEAPAKYCEPEYEDMFRSCSFFMGGNVRKAVADGRGDNISIFLHEIHELFHKRIIKSDVAFIHVSPPGNHGYCSLGTSVDCGRAGLTYSKTIVAQINKHMPRTFGNSIIHKSHFDYAIEIDTPMPQHGSDKMSEAEQKIGCLIAENLVEDGATLQMGIGNIPDAVLGALHNHKDLGIHSEMFANGVVVLVAKGCVTDNRKTYFKGRIVGSFLIGSQKLYDFVDNNRFIEMMEVDYVNSVPMIARNPRMTAINSCIEVDLNGQVSSDSIRTRFYSGFGGQVDFIRGAAEGYDGEGKPIIAMQSSSPKGVSKIVRTLKEGAGVVTSRAHVHYVVIEFGIASLFGQTMRQRAYELIKIAHPNSREKLEKEAFERLKTMPCP